MFVKNHPAMKIGSSLVIADLHLGIEYDLWLNGVNVSDQTERLANKVKLLMKKTRSKELIILGDIKNSIYMKRQEEKKITNFFELLPDISITICKGNHDGMIEDILGKNINVVSYTVRRGYILTHGHRNIPKLKEKTVVIGHNHPGIRFRDSIGGSSVEQCWVIGMAKGKSKKVIFMPSFSSLAGTMPFNEIDQKNLLGPIAKTVVLKKSKVYLLDGTYIGHLGNLKKE